MLQQAHEYADELFINAEKAEGAFQEMCQQSRPDAGDNDGLTPYESMCLTLSESLKLTADSTRLVQSVLADLPVRNPYGAGCPEEVNHEN